MSVAMKTGAGRDEIETQDRKWSGDDLQKGQGGGCHKCKKEMATKRLSEIVRHITVLTAEAAELVQSIEGKERMPSS